MRETARSAAAQRKPDAHWARDRGVR